MPSEVAVFGGSFNPPHVAHVLAATYVLACFDVEKVLIVPCYRHPFAKSLAPFSDRMEMCRLAFADLARVEISSVEEELGGDSITARTLAYLKERHPDWAMRLIVGADVVQEMDRWTNPERVRSLAPPIVLARIGVPLEGDLAGIPSVLPAVSSTVIRSRLARGERVDGIVPRAVAEYARNNGLYVEL